MIIETCMVNDCSISILSTENAKSQIISVVCSLNYVCYFLLKHFTVSNDIYIHFYLGDSFIQRNVTVGQTANSSSQARSQPSISAGG